ncbi:inositol-3-phosphate synthase [Myceligenerans pegani]|uniref:Inositol-3-phosphate synthase n=1 Tax=Myceligenerans pegani TaxID=2776917 RepID=A0ABR9N2Y5_9MICO|nr:inositol-3-phosphate synthase [Myceligenerans sp. TRM 65318]MBE1878012.1 inositol-3-phosphate synthase [Myceligenerans sp. TRM 65318]MBE3020283.1 inositol-3-phosphate synthase [Myceligenerans sp. TRM 65318]
MHHADTHANTSARTGRPGPAGRPATGLWLIGARGSVATTATLGLAALAGGHASPTGCVTARPGLATDALPDFEGIVVGGHDVSTCPLPKRAEALADAGMLPPHLVTLTRDALEAADAEVRPGHDPARPEGSGQVTAERLAADIVAFRERHGLERVVVVDVASTEPLPDPIPEHDDAGLLLAALADPDRAPLPPSSLYAYAAILAGAPYAAFTPSASAALPALVRLARERGVPVAGQDGKTGQTWLRTVLAPAMAARNLRVLSWSGTNLLGGGDGATLADPDAVGSKLGSKSRGLRAVTGTDTTPLHIDYVPDLGDVKVAWDHVHVEGFLGSRLTLQTTWSAYDSMLAAPLVLDLARLLALAHAAGLAGPVPELGFFFKDPWGSDVHDAAAQDRMLDDWVRRTAARVDATGAAGQDAR